MSNSDSGSNELNKEQKAASKTILKDFEELKNFDKEALLAYIKQLHDLFKKNARKRSKYKNKIRNLQKQIKQKDQDLKDNCTATQQLEGLAVSDATAKTPPQTEEVEEMSATAAFSFVDELRQVAEQAQNLSNYVYEPTSGLYYDQSSGYYYNMQYGLYYDGNTGCYYNYNKEKNTYEFHSQAGVQPSQSVSGAHDKNDACENYDDEVEFDEWGGVITDKEKLQQIKEEKDRRKNGNNCKKKNRKTSPTTKQKSKKCKRSRSKERMDTDADWDSKDDGYDRVAKNSQGREVEDGELSTTSSSDSGSDSENDVKVYKRGSRFQDIAKKYPPSLRIIVQETNLEQLKVGSLSLITFKGGSLGREGAHDVVIPDVNVSKFHLKFHYDTKQSIYKCIDLGSRNGTILNGVRMSASKTESDAYDVVHGSVLQIAQTKLLCHVHEGNTTCGLCEPGLLIETPRETVVVTNPTTTLTHKEQLKKLQKKYGLENEKFVEGKLSAGNYNDRAATRRIKVGSSNDNEKTQAASVHTEISSENKGFKMLAKLGWNKGETLGKTNIGTGLLEPINVASNAGTKGLGCSNASASNISMTVTDKKKLENLKKTQERYKMANIFCDSGDSD